MLDKITQLLEAGDISKEAAESIDSEVSGMISKLRDESAKYRTKLKETEDSYASKLEEQKTELEASISEAKKAGELEAVERYEEKLNTLEGEKSEMAQRTQKAILNSAVDKVLAENRVSDPDLARLFIKDKVSMDADELFVEFDGEKLSFDNGIKKIFESKPNLLESSGSPGSGAGDSGGDRHTKTDVSKMTKKEKFEYYKQKTEG